MVLMPARPAARVRRWLWRGKLGFAAAAAVLVAATMLLVNGACAAPAGDDGPCPARRSTAAYVAGRELLLRAEPVRQGVALVHLCTDRPVHHWSFDIDGAHHVAVQPVAAGQAIAAAALQPGRRTPVIVRVVPESGAPLTFVTQLIAR
jgi:hypothetical protein